MLTTEMLTFWNVLEAGEHPREGGRLSNMYVPQIRPVTLGCRTGHRKVMQSR